MHARYVIIFFYFGLTLELISVLQFLNQRVLVARRASLLVTGGQVDLNKHTRRSIKIV